MLCNKYNEQSLDHGKLDYYYHSLLIGKLHKLQNEYKYEGHINLLNGYNFNSRIIDRISDKSGKLIVTINISAYTIKKK